MELGLAGRRALVTGAAGGIGRAVVELLHHEGCLVAAADLASAPEPESHGADLWLSLDVTNEESVRDVVAIANSRFGGIDVVVGCAGISGPIGSQVTETPLDAWQRTVAVNLTGQFLLAKHTIPLLRKSADDGRGPAVVFVASDSSFVAAPGMTAYCASKGGLLMLTKALAVDHGPEGLRVNCVAPSIVDTPMSRTDLGREQEGFADAPYPVHSAADIARGIVLLASGTTSTVNGTALVMDFGGLARSAFEA